MKKFFSLTIFLVSGMACAVPQVIDLEQQDKMVHAFEQVLAEMDAVQEALNKAVSENTSTNSFAYDIMGKKCEQLRYSIAQLAVHKEVPGFAKQCQELVTKWCSVNPDRTAMKQHRKLEKEHDFWFLTSLCSYGSAAMSALLHVGYSATQWERDNIQPYTKYAVGAFAVLWLYATIKFSNLDARRKELHQEYDLFKEIFENGPKKQAQQIIDALIDIRPYCF